MRTLATVLLVWLLSCGGTAPPPPPPPPTVETLPPPAERLARAADDLRHWRLTTAEELLAPSVPGEHRVARELLLARLDLARSRYAAVDARLTPMVTAAGTPFEARVLLGRALHAISNRARDKGVLMPMWDAYEDGRVTSAADFMWLGAGLHLMGHYREARDSFGEALRLDPELHEARILFGHLLLEKHNAGEARILFDEVQTANKDDPDGQYGKALVEFSIGSPGYASPLRRLDDLLRGSNEHLPAHNLRARIDLTLGRPRDAITRLREHSLKIAPDDLEALALLAAASAVIGDQQALAAADARAMKVNARYAGLHRTIGKYLALADRPDDAIASYQRALELDPRDSRALAELGVLYSLRGDDAQAFALLERAFKIDPYDYNTYVLLGFYDEKVKNKFEWMAVGGIRLHVHTNEKAILTRYVPALLDEAQREMTRKYGPRKSRLRVEFYSDGSQLFAENFRTHPDRGGFYRRTGISGGLIAIRSPAPSASAELQQLEPGQFNWAWILWHEYIHAVVDDVSLLGVPRWFNEGLAEYEARAARPAWRFENDDLLVRYRAAGKLRGTAALEERFIDAGDASGAVAYEQGTYLIAFIVETFGAGKPQEMLRAWGNLGKAAKARNATRTTAEVVREALGIELAEFDRRFFAWLDARLATQQRNFYLPVDSVADPLGAIEQAREHPQDVAAQVRAALAHEVRGETDAALARAGAALAIDGRQAVPLFMRARARLHRNDLAGAEADLRGLLALGKDGPDIRELLARLAVLQGRDDEAVAHLEKAVAQSGRAEPIYSLFLLLDKLGRAADAYRWRRAAALVQEGDVVLVDKLLAGAARFGASDAEVLTWGEQGNHIAPFSVDHHILFARELIRIGHRDQARFEAETVLLLEPGNAQAKAMLAAP